MTLPRDIDWPAAAAALGAAFPPERWPERVRTWLGATPADEPWAVAFSGGADSLAVLLALVGTRNVELETRIGETGNRRPETGGQKPAGSTLKDASAVLVPSVLSVPSDRSEPATGGAARLVALHFNHRLRGAAADADEEFCRAVCRALGIPLVVGAANWPAGSAISEAEARTARFSFFARAMREAGARVLVLGHHRDDVVETMLLRLSRGSGSRGLAAPRPVHPMADGTVRVRPLLDVLKAEIVAALRTAGVPWCEDETNHGDAYFRNRLRRAVVPAWAAAAPADLGEAVARSRALLEEEDEALEAWVDRVLQAELGGLLPLAPLRNVPVAVARRALQRWLRAQELDEVLSRAGFEELLAAIRAGRDEARLSAGPGRFLSVRGGVLAIEAAPDADRQAGWAERVLPVPGAIALPDGAGLRAEVVRLDAALREQICAGAMDDGKTAFLGFTVQPPECLRARPWGEGDRYTPLGSHHATKLQDQFVNRRIAKRLRHHLPVVVDAAGGILWVPGLPPAHGTRIEDGSSVAVQLTYHPAEPLSKPPHGR